MRRFLFLLLTICFITQIHSEEEGDCKKEKLDHKLYENVNKCLEKIISQCNNTCQPEDILKKMLQSTDIQYTTMMTSKMFKKKGCGKEFNQKDGKWCEHMVKFLAKLAAESSTNKLLKGQKFELSDDAKPNCPKSVADPSKDDCENAIVKHCKTARKPECLWIMRRKDLDQFETIISPTFDGQKLEKMYADMCDTKTSSLCDYLEERIKGKTSLEIKQQVKGLACKKGSDMKPICKDLVKMVREACKSAFDGNCAKEHIEECEGMKNTQAPCNDYLAGQCSEKKQDSVSVKQCSDFIKVLQNTPEIFTSKLFEQCTTVSPSALCDAYANELLKDAEDKLFDCDSRNKGQDTACKRVWKACEGKKKEECPLAETMGWCKEKKTAQQCEEKIQSYCSAGTFVGHSTLCVNTVKAVSEETLLALLHTSAVCSNHVGQDFTEYCSRLAGEFGKNNLGKGIFEKDCENGAKMDESTKCKVLKHTCDINTATPSDVCSLVHSSQEILEEYKRIKIAGNSERVREVLNFLHKYCSEQNMEKCELAEKFVNKDGLSAEILEQSCAETANTDKVCGRYVASTIEVMKQGDFVPQFTKLCTEEKQGSNMCQKFKCAEGKKEEEHCELIERVFNIYTMNETVFAQTATKMIEIYLRVCDGKTEELCAKLEKRIMLKDVSLIRIITLCSAMDNIHIDGEGEGISKSLYIPEDCTGSWQLLVELYDRKTLLIKSLNEYSLIDFERLIGALCPGELCDKFMKLILKSSRFEEIYHDQCILEENKQEGCRVYFKFCEKDANKIVDMCKTVGDDEMFVKFKTDLSKEGEVPQGSANTVTATCNMDKNSTNCHRFSIEIARKEEQLTTFADLICKEEENSATCEMLLQKGHEMLDNAIAKMTEKECSGDSDTESIICKAIHLTCKNPRENVCLEHHLHHCTPETAVPAECFGYFNHYCEDISENEKKAQTCYKFLQIMIKVRKDQLVSSCTSKSKPCANAAKVDYEYSDSKLLSELFKRHCLNDRSTSGDEMCATIRKTCENTLNTHTACSLVDEPTCQFRPFNECAPYLDKHCKEQKDNSEFCQKLVAYTLEDRDNSRWLIEHYCNVTDTPLLCDSMMETTTTGGMLHIAFGYFCGDPNRLRTRNTCLSMSKLCLPRETEDCKTIKLDMKKTEVEDYALCTTVSEACDVKVKQFCGNDIFSEDLCTRLFGRMTKDVLLEYYGRECTGTGSEDLCERTKKTVMKFDHVNYLFTKTCPGLDFMTEKKCKEFRELCVPKKTAACDEVRAPYKHTSIGCIIGIVIGVLCMCAAVVWFIVKHNMKRTAIRKKAKARRKKLDSVLVA